MRHITSFDTLRFVAAIFIVLYHCTLNFKGKYFSCGNMAVELFFVLSGFLLAKTYEKRVSQKQTSLEKCQTYCANHFVRLWPEYLFSMCVTIILLQIFDKVNIQPFGLNVVMISGVGGVPRILNDSWYVPVVFWGGCLLVSLLIFAKDKAKIFILPILFFLCLFFMINNKKPFRGPYDVVGSLFSKGMIRGLLGMIIGIYTYWSCEKLQKFKKKLNPKLISTFLFMGEIVSLLGLFYTFTLQRKHHISDFNIYFYAAFLIGLLYFQKEKLLKFLSWKIWKPFTKISYMLYLTHGAIVSILAAHCSHFMKVNKLSPIVLLSISLPFAFLCYWTFIWSQERIKKLVFKK